MKHGLESLGLEPGSGILVPDYLCDVVFYPLEQLGLESRYYPVEDDLTPDWSELERQVTPTIRALLMVHYFGQPQEITRFQKFCARYQLRLIEDNAHGYGGTLDGRPLGSFGDVGVSSPRKLLGTLYGGFLWVGGVEVYLGDEVPALSHSRLRKLQQKISKRFPRLNQRVKSIARSRPSYDDPRAFREGAVEEGSLDDETARLFEEADWSRIRVRRREVYSEWREYSESRGLSAVHERLHAEANPWCFPAYASDAEEARRWCAWGEANRVVVFRWPALREELLGSDRGCLERWQRLLCFSTETPPPKPPSG